MIIKSKPNPTFSFRQFTHFVARATLEAEVEEEIKNIFYMIDKNKNGYAYTDDILNFLKELNCDQPVTESDANSLLEENDFLNMGYITYEDFIYVMLPK